MSKMQKVCHVTSVHGRYDQRILYRECVSLKEAGYDVTLLVNDELKDEIFKGVLIKSTGKSYRGKRIRRMVLGVKNIYLLAKKENADVYHFHDPELLPIAKKLKAKGKKVIFDSHENYYLEIAEKNYLPKIVRKFTANIYRIYETNVLKKIDGVIFPAKMDNLDFEVRAKRVAYVNNMPRFDELPSKSDINVEGVGICYAGGLTRQRGILYMAEAARIAQVPLFLAGRFESEKFKKEVLADSEYVIYCGELDRKGIYEFYGKCKVGIATLPRVGQYAIMKNLLTKVYEYMAMGMPVILTDIPYNREVVEKYGFGMVVDPEDSNDIAKKILYILSNTDIAKDMGCKGKELVYNEWNWGVEEKKLLGLYAKLE